MPRTTFLLVLVAATILATPFQAIADNGSYSGAGGVFSTGTTVGTDISVHGVPLSGTQATLSFACPITAYGVGTYQINWTCAGGLLSIVSSDNSVALNATFGSSVMTLTASGGGKGGHISYLYHFSGAFSGTITVGAVTQPINGTVSVNVSQATVTSATTVTSASLVWSSPNSTLSTLFVSTIGTGNGTVTSSDGQINCGSACSASYGSGSTVTLTATAAQGSTFYAWTGCDSTAGNACTLTMNNSRDASATFTGTSSGYRFVPVTPCRVADTRKPADVFGGPSIVGGTSRDFPVPQSICNIPAAAAAYSLNFTVVPHGSLGYLTVWPTGFNRPLVSILNSLDGRIKANAAVVPAGKSNAISAFASDTTDLIIDINGYFVADASQLAFYPLSPCRVLDTRNVLGSMGGPSMAANQSRDFPVQGACGIPSTALAYSLNFTVVPQHTLGYLTVWPSGATRPVVSTMNSLSGAITANAAIVPAGAGGNISAFVTDDTDLIADVNGYFAPAGSGGQSLYVVLPCRVLDTRTSSAAFQGELTVAVVGFPCAIPANAQALVSNATVAPQGALGYLTLWPDGAGQPVVSTLNALDGAITSNMAIVPTSNGSVDAFTRNKTDLILDVFSYFAP